MDAGKGAEQGAADQDPVEMADDEVSIGNLEIKRRRRQHNARQAANDEHR